MGKKDKFADIRQFFERRAPKEWQQQLRPGADHLCLRNTRALLGAGFTFDQTWIRLAAPKCSSQYWKGCLVTRPDGVQEPVEQILKRLANPTDTVAQVDPAEYQIEQTVTGWKITSTAGKYWEVEAKLSLTQDDIHSIINLLEAFIPGGTAGQKTVSLQADSHRAGDCWVGLVASYDEQRIPFIPISADIGCGMCMLPMVEVSSGDQKVGFEMIGRQLNVNNLSSEQLKILQTQVGFRARKVLARGRVAESGQVDCAAIQEALTFLNQGLPELREWVNAFTELLKDLEIHIPSSDKVLIEQLSLEQNRTLAFVMGFAMTLGSSGNHFLEMNVDSSGNLYLVIHSGSRGLGAMIYRKIAALCTVVYGESAVAMDWMAELYNRAFSALNRFAVLNRLSCAIAMLKDLDIQGVSLSKTRLICNGSLLREYLVEHNSLFSEIGAEHPEDISNLLQGVTHNGVKCFVDHSTQRKIFVMGKGAIAISARSSCGIVALRAGEGVYVMTYLNPEAKWVECDLGELSHVKEYQLITDLNQTDILLMGHGAGRSGSATQTWKNSQYDSMVAYYDQHGIWANLSPNVLGDNPEKAYKPVEDVVRQLPLDAARSSSMLRTLVNHKEGIEHRRHFRNKFAEWVHTNWDTMTSERKLTCDLVLVTHDLQQLRSPEWLMEALEEQQQIFEELLKRS